MAPIDPAAPAPKVTGKGTVPTWYYLVGVAVVAGGYFLFVRNSQATAAATEDAAANSTATPGTTTDNTGTVTPGVSGGNDFSDGNASSWTGNGEPNGDLSTLLADWTAMQGDPSTAQPLPAPGTTQSTPVQTAASQFPGTVYATAVN